MCIRDSISSSNVSNTEDFISKSRDINTNTHSLLSFDVVSLFTSVPVPLTISLLERFISENNINLSHPFPLIKQLILLTLEHNYFQFNNTYYKQNYGLSMGSPLSPILANIFMELLEICLLYTSDA